MTEPLTFKKLFISFSASIISICMQLCVVDTGFWMQQEKPMIERGRGFESFQFYFFFNGKIKVNGSCYFVSLSFLQTSASWPNQPLWYLAHNSLPFFVLHLVKQEVKKHVASWIVFKPRHLWYVWFDWLLLTWTLDLTDLLCIPVLFAATTACVAAACFFCPYWHWLGLEYHGLRSSYSQSW